MAKSKIVKANEKIAEGVATGYKKIENGVACHGFDNIVGGEQGLVIIRRH